MAARWQDDDRILENALVCGYITGTVVLMMDFYWVGVLLYE
jgi:hypothetical protein